MKRTAAKLAVDSLAHADWNPRAPEELDWKHPEMVELIQSVSKIGIIQPIAVWADKEAIEKVNQWGITGIVVAGNRRLEAAKAAGHKEIPALVFTEINEAQAQLITRIENESRIDIDPLKDASLIGSMVGLGYSQKEIAAHFGVSEAKVCRRRKLLELTPKIREHAEAGDCNITIDALEQIAAYPREIQERCTSDVLRRAKISSTPIRWVEISYIFARETSDLDCAEFNCDECKECPKRTGAQPDLWGDMEDGAKLGKCLDKKCYVCKAREHALGQIRKKVGKRVELIDSAANGVVVPAGELFAEKRDAKHPACWYWFNSYDAVNYRFGPTVEDYKKAWEKAEKAMEKAKARLAEEEARKEEEEKRADALREDQEVLLEALDRKAAEIAAAVKDKIPGEGGEAYIAKHLLGFIKSKQQRDAIAALLFAAFNDNYGIEHETVAICEAFPKFATKCGVTAKDLKAYAKAKSDLADFKKKNKIKD